MVFCGILEICWFVSLKIIDDPANDMAVINISHVNMVINSLEGGTFQLRLVGDTELLVACSCICKLVNFGWSVSRSMGRKYPGLLKMSLRPEF